MSPRCPRLHPRALASALAWLACVTPALASDSWRDGLSGDEDLAIVHLTLQRLYPAMEALQNDFPGASPVDGGGPDGAPSEAGISVEETAGKVMRSRALGTGDLTIEAVEKVSSMYGRYTREADAADREATRAAMLPLRERSLAGWFVLRAASHPVYDLADPTRPLADTSDLSDAEKSQLALDMRNAIYRVWRPSETIRQEFPEFQAPAFRNFRSPRLSAALRVGRLGVRGPEEAAEEIPADHARLRAGCAARRPHAGPRLQARLDALLADVDAAAEAFEASLEDIHGSGGGPGLSSAWSPDRKRRDEALEAGQEAVDALWSRFRSLKADRPRRPGRIDRVLDELDQQVGTLVDTALRVGRTGADPEVRRRAARQVNPLRRLRRRLTRTLGLGPEDAERRSEEAADLEAEVEAAWAQARALGLDLTTLDEHRRQRFVEALEQLEARAQDLAAQVQSHRRPGGKALRMRFKSPAYFGLFLNRWTARKAEARLGIEVVTTQIQALRDGAAFARSAAILPDLRRRLDDVEAMLESLPYERFVTVEHLRPVPVGSTAYNYLETMISKLEAVRAAVQGLRATDLSAVAPARVRLVTRSLDQETARLDEALAGYRATLDGPLVTDDQRRDEARRVRAATTAAEARLARLTAMVRRPPPRDPPPPPAPPPSPDPTPTPPRPEPPPPDPSITAAVDALEEQLTAAGRSLPYANDRIRWYLLLRVERIQAELEGWRARLMGLDPSGSPSGR